MSPDNQPLEPIPIDPPDNTGASNAAAELDPDAIEAPAPIDPPDNT